MNDTQAAVNTERPATPAAKKASAPARKATARTVSKKPVAKASPVLAASADSATATPKVSVTAKTVKATKTAKVKKTKLVRDSFTIPKDEYEVVATLKLRCAKLAQPAKKSELLRAGIKALAAMSDKNLLDALKAVPPIKTGRPRKD